MIFLLSEIHHPPSKISASFTSCSPLPFRSPVSGFSFFFTPHPVNSVNAFRTQNPNSFFLLPSHFCLHPSNKCAQIAKEWLDKGLAKCHEIAVLYPSCRNPLAWIGKIHGTSFVDTSALSSAANPKSNIQNLTSPLSPPCHAGVAKREGGPQQRHRRQSKIQNSKFKINIPPHYPCPS